MNPAVWVERHGRLRPDAPAIAEGERVHADWRTFAAGGTAAVATSLREEYHLSPGERVAVVMRNRPEYLEALFGAWHAGMVAGAGERTAPPRRDRGHLEHSAAAVVVTDDDHAADVESLVGTVATLRSVVVAPGEQRTPSSPPHRRRWSSVARPTRRGSSTRAVPPADRRGPRSPTGTC